MSAVFDVLMFQSMFQSICPELMFFLGNFFLSPWYKQVNGYGDFVPHSTGERSLTLLLMIIGSALYGYAIGEICDKTGNLNPAQQEYQQNMVRGQMLAIVLCF